MDNEVALDEMVDGAGGIRPHWRRLLGVLSTLGPEELRARGAALDAAFEEEGIGALLPSEHHGGWRCDPLPLPIPASEFAVIEAGLTQRASLLDAILADLYGRQELLSNGRIPAALVWPNPNFLRPCRTLPDGPRLHLYAADLVRGPNGAWHVLADRTAEASGLAYVLENRRMLSRMLPELYQPHAVMPLRPFMDGWQDILRSLLPPGKEGAGIGILTAGSAASPLWAEHVLLARELSCTLVEGGDLTVRQGAVFLKTLRGLRPVGLLLRREEGVAIDPLELAANSTLGVPGLLDAARAGSVRIVNHPGSALVETPGLAAFLPDLAGHMLDEELMLPQVPSLWLGEPKSLERVLRTPERWLIRPALDGRAAPIRAGALAPDKRRALQDRLAAEPAAHAAVADLAVSVAPCVAPKGLEPKPVVLRVFLVSDGTGWHALPGGLARMVAPVEPLSGRLPGRALAKDVWVLADQGANLVGPPVPPAPVLMIRRTAGDLPSRVADNFFWFGRYLERLDGACRLLHAAVQRIERPSPSPRELAELDILAACLARAELVPPQPALSLGAGPMAAALIAALRSGGTVATLLGNVARITELLRDRMTDEMHVTMGVGVRSLREALRGRAGLDEHHALEEAGTLIGRALDLCAAMSGLIAENMVRGGGRLFLDLGRRVERGQEIATEAAAALEHPASAREPGRVVNGLRLVLELRDSVLTYRSRYLGVLQPAPALDLVLADEGNPRGLAFQLADIEALLEQIAGDEDRPFQGAATRLRVEVDAMVREVQTASDQTVAAASLPDRLAAVQHGIADLSDAVSRRYFALLPATQSLGIWLEPATDGLMGAA
jgi:uncharacterized circularly permuted ATP-grasp superfamily protein/uncharacterized alpha-E superfamily protein